MSPLKCAHCKPGESCKLGCMSPHKLDDAAAQTLATEPSSLETLVAANHHSPNNHGQQQQQQQQHHHQQQLQQHQQSWDTAASALVTAAAMHGGPNNYGQHQHQHQQQQQQQQHQQQLEHHHHHHQQQQQHQQKEHYNMDDEEAQSTTSTVNELLLSTITKLEASSRSTAMTKQEICDGSPEPYVAAAGAGAVVDSSHNNNNNSKAEEEEEEEENEEGARRLSEQVQMPSSTGPGPLRKKRSLEDKICRICGDKALAHNFDVITCESCKAFFRRNALRREELRECAFQRSCPINIRTRRFCSACRLKKCFAIGMRADMILGEKKRRARLEKISIKRSHSHSQQRQRPGASSDSNGDSQPSSDEGSAAFNQNLNPNNPHLNPNNPHPQHQQQQHPIHGGGHGEDLSSSAGVKSSYAPRAAGFEPVPVGQLPSDPHMYWRLTEEERALLTQISATYQNTILRLPQQGGASERTERAVNSITLEDLLGRCDVCANNVVKLMKGLADYRMLQVEDQLAALKACAMRTLVLKGAACFVVERDAWIKAYGELPVSLFVRLTGHEKLIRQHAQFCKALKTLLKNDVTMYALLQCVLIFDPRQPNIADRQLVNSFRDKYMVLLKHYLESQVSYEHAERYMDFLKDKLEELTVLGHKMTGMFKEWTGLIQPLMIEVLSLA